MGKKKKDKLTEESQYQMMLETTRLASVYTRDPDEGVYETAHPLGDRIKEAKKKEKKKKKKKEKAYKKSGLGLLYTAEEAPYEPKGSKVMKGLQKVIGKSSKIINAKDDEEATPTYKEDPENEAFADQITNALFSTQDGEPEEEKPKSIPTPRYQKPAVEEILPIVTYDMKERSIVIKDLDNDIIYNRRQRIQPSLIPLMLKCMLESFSDLFNEYFIEHKNDDLSDHNKVAIDLWNWMKESQESVEDSTEEPEHAEELKEEKKYDISYAVDDNAEEENTNAIYYCPQDEENQENDADEEGYWGDDEEEEKPEEAKAPLTSKLNIPDSVRQAITAKVSGDEEGFAAAMDKIEKEEGEKEEEVEEEKPVDSRFIFDTVL